MLSTISLILFDVHFLGAFFQTIILILVGFFFRRKGLINDSGKSLLSTLIWKLAVPCFAFNAFMQDFNKENFIASINEFVLSIIFYIILIFIGKMIFIKKGKDISTLAALFMAIGQTTLFSMPILQSVYEGREHSSEVMLYISTISIVFRIFVYIIGFCLISGEKIRLSFLGSSLKKVFFTPVMIGMFLGIFVFLIQNITYQVNVDGTNYSFLRIDKTLPIFYVTVKSVAAMVSPLSMLLIGMSIGQANFAQSIKDKTAWIIALLRNFISPIIIMILCFILKTLNIIPFTEYAAIALIIGFSAPISVSLSIMCVQYHREETLASRSCVISTLLTIVSLPIMFVLGILIF